MKNKRERDIQPITLDSLDNNLTEFRVKLQGDTTTATARLKAVMKKHFLKAYPEVVKRKRTLRTRGHYKTKHNQTI